MNWIYLFKGKAEPIATGIFEETVYAVAKTEEEAIEKVTRAIPGNYEV